MPTPRKPTHLKIVSGTTRPHKRGQKENLAEPKPRHGIPEMPDRMSDVARETWPKLAGILDRMGVLTEADGQALERTCELVSEITMLQASFANPVEIMRSDGDGFDTVAQGGEPTYVTYGKSGPMLRTRPELAAIADADRRLRAYLNDFGLTPAARSKVQTKDTGPGSVLDDFFG